MGLASLAAHWLALGTRLGGDSPRYLEAAARLLAGLPLVDKQADFLAYDWLVAAVLSLDGGQAGVVAVQVMLSLAAGGVFFLGASRTFGPAAGLAAALAYVLWPDLQRWNFYILSDGPFNSLLAGCLGLALMANRQPCYWLALAPALVLLTLTRPEGLFFLPPLAVYFGLCRRPASLVLLLAGLGLALGLKGPSPATSAEILEHWGRGTVIWGYAALDHPPALATAGHTLAGWLWAALTQDTWNLLAAMGQRAFWFLVHARPFYSLGHNLLAGLSSLLLLGLALWGAWAGRGSGGQRALPWMVVLMQLALSMLTWADWDGRFLTRVTPALMLLAAEALLGQEARDPLLEGPGRFDHL